MKDKAHLSSALRINFDNEEPKGDKFYNRGNDKDNFNVNETTVEQLKQKVYIIQTLTGEERAQLYELLSRDKSVFNDRPVCHQTYVYGIKFTDEIIVRDRKYPIPIGKKKR